MVRRHSLNGITPHHRSAPVHLGFLLDELRRAGVTTYADLASTLNRQGIRPRRGRWSAHDLHLVMRRHRRLHPSAAEHIGPSLYRRRAEEARRVIRRLRRRGFETQEVIARALNARGVNHAGARSRLDRAQRLARFSQRDTRASSAEGEGQASLVFPHSGVRTLERSSLRAVLAAPQGTIPPVRPLNRRDSLTPDILEERCPPRTAPFF